MEIIVLLDDYGRALHLPGNLHAARPDGSGSLAHGSLTLCGKPTAAMDVLGPRTPGHGVPVFPPNLVGAGEGHAAECPVCVCRAAG
ncbi:hypothetical protein GCM10023205_76860 [Yinghuangia aomiensis]|uniref:PAAR motif-containing protein n=1 Tax=Yinghuangia aomiensis TaxID=676205 RepID=A0ABP9I9V3_9ACTN